MQQQSSPNSLRTILILVLRELNASCCCRRALKSRCKLSWYSLTNSVRNYLAFSFSAVRVLLLISSYLSLRILSAMNYIFSSKSALFSLKIQRSCLQIANVCSKFLVINRSQKEFQVAGEGLISLSASSGGSSFDLECCRDSIWLSSLLPFSYSSSDSSSTKVLLCKRVLSSAYFAYFLRSILRRSVALRRPNFELVVIIIIMSDKSDRFRKL